MPAKEEKITVTRPLPGGKVKEKTMTKTQYALLGSNPGWQHKAAGKPKEADAEAAAENPEEPAPGEEFPEGEIPTEADAEAPATSTKAAKKK